MIQPERIYIVYRVVVDEAIEVQPVDHASRVSCDEAAVVGIIISVLEIVKPGFLVVVLSLEKEIVAYLRVERLVLVAPGGVVWNVKLSKEQNKGEHALPKENTQTL
jgi:hypothetical protein